MPSAAERIQARRAATAAAPKQKKGGGIFSSLPGIGGVTAIKELGMGLQAIPTIISSLAPGGKKSMLPQVGRGFASSVLGTVATGTKWFGVPGTEFNVADKLIEPAGAWALGDEYKPKDFMEKARDRGIIPALVEDIGNVALVGGIAKAPLTAASKVATAGVDTARAAEAAAVAGGDAARVAEAASATERAVARAGKAAGRLEKADVVAHPYRSFAHGFGDVARAARARALPGVVTEVAGKADDVADLTKGREAMKVADEAAGVADEVGPAYEHLTRHLEEPTPQAADQFSSLLAEAQGATKTAAAAIEPDFIDPIKRGEEALGLETTKVAPPGEIPVPEGHTRVYRGEDAEYPTRGTQFSEKEQYARNFAGSSEGGKVYAVDVPDEELAKYRAQNAEDQGFDLPTEIADRAHDVTVKAETVAEAAPELKKGPKTVGDEAAQNDYRAAEEAAKRELGVDAKTVEEARILGRLGPPNQRAVNLVEKLPDSVNRVVAKFAVPITKSQIRKLARDYSRYVEISQKMARSSPAVTAALGAAEQIMAKVPGMERFDLSRMVGEELGKRLDGTAFLDEAVKSSASGDPAMAMRLRDIATRGMNGITPEVWDLLKKDPQAYAETHRFLQEATEGFKVDAAQRYKTLLASRRGGEGLEQAILGDEAPMMSPGQVKRYKRAQKDLRRQIVNERRAMDAQSTLQAEVNKQALRATRAEAEVEVSRAVYGEKVIAQEANSRAIPVGLQKLNETVADIVDATVKGGGVTYDIGKGARVVADETSGHVVSISPNELFNVPLEEFIATGGQAVRDALQNPEVRPYWDGDDARLGTWTYEDETGQTRVAGDISVSTWHGKKLERYEAEQLARAMGQKAYGDLAAYARGDNGDINIPEMTPQQETIAGIYLGETLKPNSPTARVARELYAAAEENPHLTPEDVAAQLHAWQTWDYGLTRTHPNEFKIGDFFKTFSVKTGKTQPRGLAYLGQTVLGMSTDNAVEAALLNLDLRQVSDSLAWYYDSHDYIESSFRGKQIQLLNGETRDAADVFYDLLAVTSVMASPKQNLGRSLMALSNTEEFLSTKAKAMAAAKELMAEFEKTDNSTVRMRQVDGVWEEVGTDDIMRANARGQRPPGTPMARRFAELPAVRAITHQTSMTTAPKYNVFDILSGKLKLSEATNADIARLPEAWTGEAKSISDATLPRQSVLRQMDTLGITGPGRDAYGEWAARMDDLINLRERIKQLGPDWREALAETQYPTKAAMEKAYKGAKAEEQAILGAYPEVVRAKEQALMEHSGSKALAKLRSFRDNLANPAESTAVTMDSVMASIYGYPSTHWGLSGKYAQHANEIRDMATELTERFGREVKPHEVQALLWVYAKTEIGKQDWARFLGHSQHGMDQIDALFDAAQRGDTAGLRGWDPLEDYWDEELGYSRQIAEDRANLTKLEKLEKKGAARLLPEEAEELAQLRALRDEGQLRADRVVEEPLKHGEGTRKHIPFDAKKLSMKEEQYQTWLKTRDDIVQQIRDGDHEGAQKTFSSYAQQQRRAIEGDTGGSFQVVGEETRNNANDSAAIAEERLQTARNIPAPRQWRNKFISSLAARYNRKYGLPEPRGVDLDVQVNPARTREVARAIDDVMENGNAVTPEVEATYRALQQSIDQQYDFMTNELGLNVEFVPAGQEYGGIGVVGNGIDSDRAAHAALVQDVKENNHLFVRSTEMSGDGANQFMMEKAPDGLTYNDKLRAVHDFYGHAQAGNDFGRHGENVAAMLHTQMFPEEAHAALMTEFRAQTAKLIEGGAFYDQQPVGLLPEPMRGVDYMSEGGDELFQRFGDKLRGATVFPTNKSNRLIMRLFEGANIDTLMHEGGHLLRQILPDEDIPRLRSRYRGLLNKTHAGREVAEETFVNDLMQYMRQKVNNPELVPGPMDDIFNRIASTLEEQYAAQMDTLTGRTLPNEIVDFWDGMFNPEIVRPDKMFDPLQQQVVNVGEGTTKKFRWETDEQFAKRAVQFGRSKGEAATAEFKLQLKEKVAAQQARNLKQMQAMLAMPNRHQVLADRLGARAGATLDKLAQELETTTGAAVPAQWQPLQQASQELWASLDDMDPEQAAMVAEMLDEIPQTFSEVLKYAAARGFDPTHLPEMTWEKGQKALFGHVKLGKKGRLLDVADTRKARTGALTATGRTERSIETLAAGLVDATHEMYSGRLIEFIEDNYAKPLPPGSTIPEGWVPWDPEKQYLMTGSRPEAGVLKSVSGQDTRYMVPREIREAIDSMSQDYDHWAFRGLTRVTSPWKTMLLTLSPKWYINAFVGNTIAATAEGVRMTDWIKAWKRFKAKNPVREIEGRSFANVSIDEGGIGSTLVERGVRDTLSAEGKRAALHRVRQRMTGLQDKIDNFARTAVYEKTLRTSGGNRNLALTRAVEALVDYGNLSPFERHFVRAVVPFYAWQKGVLKLVARFPADHPLATVALTNLGRVQQEMLEDLFGGEVPQAYEGIVPGLPGGTRNLRALNPFLDASALLTPQGIAQNTNPVVDIMLRDALGAPEGGYVDKYEIGPTGSAIPDVDPISAAFEQIRGLPQVRLGEQTTGSGGDVYNQEPGLEEAIGRFAGAGRTYTPEEIAAVRGRVGKAQARVAGANSSSGGSKGKSVRERLGR